jgi:hypothetical protein
MMGVLYQQGKKEKNKNVKHNYLPDSFKELDADERGKRGKESFQTVFFDISAFICVFPRPIEKCQVARNIKCKKGEQERRTGNWGKKQGIRSREGIFVPRIEKETNTPPEGWKGMESF